MANGGWTLIARFSNADSANWMQNSGNWWYDRTTAYGSVTSRSNNYDMISPAFWLVQGSYIKVSRSDDSSNTRLLETSSCTGGRTFRSFITSFGNFRYSATWNSNACHRSCSINHHDGSYSSTEGFRRIHCSSNIGGSDFLSFWCDWSSGDGAVMMIDAAGRTLVLVSQRLMMQASTHRFNRATLVTRAAPEPQVIHSIFGINSVKFAASFN